MEKHVFIPHEWKRWIAENVLLNQPLDRLAAILVQNGFPADLARLEVDAASRHPFVQAGQSAVRKLQKRDWMLNLLCKLQTINPSTVVERVDNLSQSEFLNDYYSQNRPVIMTKEIVDWPALALWNEEYLISKAGDQMVEIQANRNSDRNFELNKEKHRKVVRFADFASEVFSSAQTNDVYMTANNSGANARFLECFLNDFGTLPKFLDGQRRQAQSFFWLGPPGTITPVHHDLTNNFMIQVVGRKLVRLIPPSALPNMYNYQHCFSMVDLDGIDYEKFPLFRQVPIMDVELHAGDVFFLPVGWWHYVRGLDVSITITCTNFLYMNDFNPGYDFYGPI